MSNPTTPFGWQMPEATDLVTDLPADFEVFGQAVATSMQDLLGGTTGQVLAKASDTDMDFVWSADAAGMANPMTTTSDMIYSSSGSTPDRIGIGSNGDVLTVTAGVPGWAAPASSGGMTLISETVLSSNSGLNLTGISGSYKQLLLVWSGVDGALNNRFVLRLNNDSTSGIYALAQFGATGSTLINTQGTSTNIDSNGMPPFGYNVDPLDVGEQYKAQGEFLIDNYSSSTKYKTFFGKWSFYDGGDNVNKACNVVGVYKSTSAVTSIDVVRTEGSSTMSNLSNTSVRLYGIN